MGSIQPRCPFGKPKLRLRLAALLVVSAAFVRLLLSTRSPVAAVKWLRGATRTGSLPVQGNVEAETRCRDANGMPFN